MLTDSHCHLASHRFDPTETDAIISRAMAAGVNRLVTLATSLKDLDANLSIANHPAVHACLGIHPCDVHHAPDDALEHIAKHLDDPRVCAIGETGLDYFHPAPEGWDEDSFRARQRLFLERHFSLAASSGLNVVVHTRDKQGAASFEDALKIYRGFHDRVRAVFHCFIGSWENASRVIELGGLVSFGGVCTFRNAREALESAVRCPAGSFMLETDAPYLAPEPHRGRRNEPAYAMHTAEFLAMRRSESLSELASHTSQASSRFFRFRSAMD